MKIYSTNSIYQKNFSNPKVRQNRREFMYQTNMLKTANSNLAFKGFGGKVTGGLLGMGGAGLLTLASMATPAGWIAATVFIASEIGGAVVGGTIGDKLTGKDD